MWRDARDELGGAAGEPARVAAQPRERDHAWFARAVLYPFALTRAALVVVAWFGTQFAPSWTYFDPVGATRGYGRVPLLALDVWGRYDTTWYLDVAANGYRPPADLLHAQ